VDVVTRAISMLGDAIDPSADVETVDKVEDRRRAIRFESDRENLFRWDLRQPDLPLVIMALILFSLWCPASSGW
jgi:hypothetical protein